MSDLLFLFEEGFMEDIQKVEIILKEYLKESQLKIYSIEKVKEFGFNILRVLIEGNDYLKTEEIETINRFLSDKLDLLELYDNAEYMLEVSSVGLEKEVKSSDELNQAIGKYFYLETEDHQYYGYLMSFENSVVSLKINLKGRIKTIKISYDEIKYLRYAVKC